MMPWVSTTNQTLVEAMVSLHELMAQTQVKQLRFVQILMHYLFMTKKRFHTVPKQTMLAILVAMMGTLQCFLRLHVF